MRLLVNLTKRVKLADGTTRFYPAVISANGRVKPNFVLIDGKEVERKDGTYYLDWRESGKRIRQAVGPDAGKANGLRERRENILNGKTEGMIAKDVSDGRTLAVAVDEYLEDIKNSRAKKTWWQYAGALKYFKECCKKLSLTEITKRDLIAFSMFLREKKKLHPRTVWTKFAIVVGFLKAQKITGLLTKGDWPRYTEEPVEIYEESDLEKFFAACDSTEHLWFDFFLKTGMREQEVMHCTWNRVNLGKRVVSVASNPKYDFNPKTFRPREIPIPESLAAALKTWKGEREDRDCDLIFPTKGCRPKNNFLDDCKAVAERAGLDPSTFWLHKFRATFCTRALRKGVDLRTVQTWMGHKDLQSTMRYLKPNEGEAVRGLVNAMWD